MTEVLVVGALGFCTEVRCEDEALTEYLGRVLALLAVDGGSELHRYVVQADTAPGSVGWELVFDNEVTTATTERWAMVNALVHDLNRRIVESSPHLLLHAGGVVGDGVTVALPGVSGAGKSTLTAGLVRAGLGYVTDEALAFDRDTLDVMPYPKPLSIDPGAWEFFPELTPSSPPGEAYEYTQWQVSAADIRPDPLVRHCPTVGVVIFPRFEAGADTALTPLHRGEALVELAKSTFRFNERGASELDLLADLARKVACYRLTMGGLPDAVDLVTALVGVAPLQEQGVLSQSTAVGADDGFIPVPEPTVHTVEIDGEAVLLDQTAERLHHLNMTAALVWACLDGESSVDQIAADLSAEFGVAFDTVLADTTAVIRHLGDEGLLVGVDAEERRDG